MVQERMPVLHKPMNHDWMAPFINWLCIRKGGPPGPGWVDWSMSILPWDRCLLRTPESAGASNGRCRVRRSRNKGHISDPRQRHGMAKILQWPVMASDCVWLW